MNTIENKAFHDILLTSLNRVNTMAQIHELIYGHKDLSGIDIEEYFEQLIYSLDTLYEHTNGKFKISFDFDLKEKSFDPDKAIPLGLILNEIASNAYKYASNEKSEIMITLKDDDEFYYFTFSDNGPGMPKEIKSNTLGLSLISILCEQIDAELDSKSSPKGLTYSIKFSK